MPNEDLHKIAQKIMSGHRGILASDERPSSANKNLQKAGIEATDETRRKYRELFINTPDLEKYINGIILHEETLWQRDSEQNLFRETLLGKGIEIIIKVDDGTQELPGSPNEVFTKGLENIDGRLQKYYEAGARLAKWRSVIRIGDGIPTDLCLSRNSEDLAIYSISCQNAGVVPVIEPEVLIEGTHTIEKAEDVIKNTLFRVFEEQQKKNVDLKGVILKTSMVLPGKECDQGVSPAEIAEATVRTLRDSVPDELHGVVFLSGGQKPEEATSNLNEIAKKEPLPWEITFSFLRAIEGPPTAIWQGRDENVESARKEFISRLENNVLADEGRGAQGVYQ